MIIMLSLSHFILILIGIILIFGSKKFPQIMENFSKGLKHFKKGMMEDECYNRKQKNKNYKKTSMNKK